MNVLTVAQHYFRLVRLATLNRLPKVLFKPRCIAAVAVVSALATGCAQFKPDIPPSTGHISAPV